MGAERTNSCSLHRHRYCLIGHGGDASEKILTNTVLTPALTDALKTLTSSSRIGRGGGANPRALPDLLEALALAKIAFAAAPRDLSAVSKPSKQGACPRFHSIWELHPPPAPSRDVDCLVDCLIGSCIPRTVKRVVHRIVHKLSARSPHKCSDERGASRLFRAPHPLRADDPAAETSGTETSDTETSDDADTPEVPDTPSSSDLYHRRPIRAAD